MRSSPPPAAPSPSPLPAAVARAIAAAWIAVAIVIAGCGRPTVGTEAPRAPSVVPSATPADPAAEPALDGLLVAAGGPLLVTDVRGSLVAFDPPSVPVLAVTATAGTIVTIDESGDAAILDGSAPAPAWTDLPAPNEPGVGAIVRLVAIGPLGRQLAIASGVPQGASFDLALLDLASRTAHTIPVGRGLNGSPTWIGPDAVAIDVIRDDGGSGIASIDIATGVVTNRLGPATIVAASNDGLALALDDPATGDVLIGDLAAWRAGAFQGMTRIHGPPGTGVDRLAMNAAGHRLAVVRRTDTGSTIEILVRREGGWHATRTLTVPGDGSLGIAWRD